MVRSFWRKGASAMSASNLAQLMNKYRHLGVITAGELLLHPEDALDFANELRSLGIAIIAVNLWYITKEGNKEIIAEDPNGMSMGNLLTKNDRVEETIAAARNLITHKLPERTTFVSFVLDDPYWDRFPKGVE